MPQRSSADVTADEWVLKRFSRTNTTRAPRLRDPLALRGRKTALAGGGSGGGGGHGGSGSSSRHTLRHKGGRMTAGPPVGQAAAKKKPKKQPKPINASLLEPVGPRPPPCPDNSLPRTVRLKAAGRQWACAHPTVRRAINGSGPMPLVWSQELVTTRKVFMNENPFETSKFRPFMTQLPPSSNLSEILHGSGGLRCSTCDTCAVVGASGSLLNRRHGALINAHEVVIRPNWLRMKGFEDVVGTRTDLNLFFGVEGMIDQFDVAQRKLPREQRALGLVTPASDRSVASFFRHMSRMHKNRTRSCRKDCTGVYLLSDDVYHRALGELCRATGGGCTWQKATSRMRPSTGFFSVMLAMQLCRKVSLFGLTTDPCQPFHYYGTPKAQCTHAIPAENDESVHWFEKEHAIYHELEKGGRVTVYS